MSLDCLLGNKLNNICTHLYILDGMILYLDRNVIWYDLPPHNVRILHSSLCFAAFGDMHVDNMLRRL
jgi:hypothetical protein